MEKDPQSDLVNQVAKAILTGFDRHFKLFQEITRAAKKRFQTADWEGEINARVERIAYYDQRVNETVGYIQSRLNVADIARTMWQDIKRQYLWLLYDHKQPELAESFYNSVFCRLFDRRYFNNRHIFVKPGSAVDFLDMEDPAYDSFYPENKGVRETIREILLGFDLDNEWEDLERDIDLLGRDFDRLVASDIRPTPHSQIQVVSSLFYRNKAAYIVGCVLIGQQRSAFIIPLLVNDSLEIYADTLISKSDEMAMVFSFTRAYFMVYSEVPSGLVSFLQKLLPTRSRADLYTAIGFQKQGKTLFYREFLHHLEHSTDKLIIAPGIKGMVMSVFTLPSFPYVFKVIKDHFAPPKNIDRATVKEKYQLVKLHDRVGRMADTLEFSHVAFPIKRFSEKLLEELKDAIPSSLAIENDKIIIRHLYIERKMVPLNIYLDHADDSMLERCVRSYGNAIKEMIAANIFPGDMLLKNFGVTSHGRVVFYDYDEICHMTDIRIRTIPQARSEEEMMLPEPWFHVAEDDFFPEQFEHFVINHPKVRERFLASHPELLEPAYWKQIQRDVIARKRNDVFPYKPEQRYCNRYPERYSVK